MNPKPDRESNRLIAWLPIAMICGMALLIRVYHLDVEAFWQDEIHSMYNSAGNRGEVERVPYGVILHDLPRFWDLTPSSTIGQVWRTMDDDSHPPLYFMLLLLWRRLVGDGEAAVRMMPVVFSVLSIIPAWLTARELGAKRAAVLLASLLALSFCHINMAQENRPYSLSGLLVGISFWLLARMEVRWSELTGRARVMHVVLYSATLFVAMMNHYFAGFAFCGQALYVMLRFRGAPLRAWLAGVVVAGLLFLAIWGPHLWHQRNFIAGQDWLRDPEVDRVQRAVLRMTDLPVRFLFRTARFALNQWNSVMGATLLAGTCVLLWQRRVRAAVLLACWYFVPVLMFVAVDVATRRQHLTHFRYSSVAIPGLVGMIALAVMELPRVLRWAAAGGLLAACIPTLLYLPANANPHVRAAASMITRDLRPSDLIVYDATGWPSFWGLRLYEMVSYYIPGSPPTLLLREDPDDALKREISQFDRLYVISPRIDGIPNPVPETHGYVEASDHFVQVGWVYRCSKSAGSP